jgi:hypothetical protein
VVAAERGGDGGGVHNEALQMLVLGAVRADSRPDIVVRCSLVQHLPPRGSPAPKLRRMHL